MARKHTGKAKQRARRSARGINRDQEALGVFDGLCREVLATQGREVLASHDPLQAEMWVSHLLGVFGGLPIVGQPDPVAAVGGRLVSAARRSPTPQAQMCLRALAAVAGGLLGRRAETAAQQLGASRLAAPRWIDAIGTAEPTTAWRATDLWGDQDGIMIGFAYPDRDEHTLVVLVDHPLGGIAKDAAVLGPLAEVVRGWQETSDTDLVEEPVEVAAARVVEAVDSTTRTVDPPVTEDYNDTQALLRARLAPLAAALPGDEPLSYEDREALVRLSRARPTAVEQRRCVVVPPRLGAPEALGAPPDLGPHA
ncbi:MAG TPA: hypothetical protein VK988_19245 [Acidimicrobiales bacterium]|nr:hypothetical protein [Acidimicrobiales bacterium]